MVLITNGMTDFRDVRMLTRAVRWTLHLYLGFRLLSDSIDHMLRQRRTVKNCSPKAQDEFGFIFLILCVALYKAVVRKQSSSALMQRMWRRPSLIADMCLERDIRLVSIFLPSGVGKKHDSGPAARCRALAVNIIDARLFGLKCLRRCGIIKGPH